MTPFRALAAVLVVVGAVFVWFAFKPEAPREDAPQARAETAASEGAARPVSEPMVDGVPAPSAPEAQPKRDTVKIEEPKAEAEHAEGAAQDAPRAIVGRVIDEAGRPVAGSRVTLGNARGMIVLDENGKRTESGAMEARSGADGRFRIDDAAVRFGLDVRAEPDNLVAAQKSLPSHVAPGTDPVDVGDLVCVLGGSISGRIVDEAGNGIAGAKVSAWTPEHAAGGGPGMMVFGDTGRDNGRITTSDGAGNFRIDGLKVGTATALAEKDGFAVASRRDIEVERGGLAGDVRLTLAAGASIAGTVTGPDGKPIAGAVVSVMDTVLDFSEAGLGGSFERTKEATVDATGSFALGGLKKADYHVFARAPGCLNLVRKSVPAGTRDLRLALERSGVVHGCVRQATDGKAVADFDVDMDFDGVGFFGMGPIEPARVLRGAEAAAAAGVDEAPGLFAIVDLPSTKVGFTVRAHGFAPVKVSALDVAAGGRVTKDVEMTPALTLTGVVLGPERQPIANASVTLSAVEEDSGPGGFRTRVAYRAGAGHGTTANFIGDDGARHAVTDEAGRFELTGLEAGNFELRASHDEWAPSDKQTLELKAGAEIDEVTLLVKAGGAVEGKTFDADGNVLADAQVTLRRADAGGGGGGKFMKFGRGGPPPFGDEGDGPLSAQSDSEGHYIFKGVPPGSYKAELARPAGARGDVMMIAMAGMDDASKGTPVTVEEGQTATLDLSLAPTGNIEGAVSATGNALANVAIGLREEDAPFPMNVASDRTDDDGKYVLEDVEPGSYELVVAPKGAGRPIVRKVEVRARETVRLDVALPVGSIRGEVKDSQTHKPIAGVVIEAAPAREGGDAPKAPQARRAVAMVMRMDSGGGAAQSIKIGDDGDSVVTDSEGRYELKFLEPGDYEVSVRGAGVAPQRKDRVKVAADRQVDNVDFAVERGGTIALTVKAPPGESVDFIVVSFKSDADPGNEERRAEPGTRMTIDGLKPGRYTVEVSSGKMKGSGAIDVKSGETAPLEVSVE